MTLKEAQKIAQNHGFVLVKTWVGEYRIKRKGDSISRAIYTDTIEDALNSGKEMEANILKGIKKYWVI